MNNLIVETHGITKTYRAGSLDVPVLKGIDLGVERGEILSIMGPSGCGKTTLMNLLGGLDHPISGTVRVNGKYLGSMSDDELTKFRLREIGFVFQFLNLIPTLTAAENVRLPLIIAGRDRRDVMERSSELLDQVGLSDKLRRMPHELSGGEQQRVAVARALANKPSIILADEPTGNLDSKTAASLIDLFNFINDEGGQTFILVTHDSEVAESADRIIYMRDGKIEDELRKETRYSTMNNEELKVRVKILKTLDELDTLFVTNQLEREIYSRLRSNYIKRLSEIEIIGSINTLREECTHTCSARV
jgi:putative ABC transport system ATP-binding protein